MDSGKLQNLSKLTRKPKQIRGINTKEKIVEAALALFCEKGYYKTTTNEIALRAGVSIGSLYSYFQDKDKIFFDILEKYHEKFEVAKSEILSQSDLYKTDSRAWIKALIDKLIKVHEDTKELNRELTVLSYYNPQVAQILEQNRKRTMDTTIGNFIKTNQGKKLKDAEASITVGFDLISATVDRIVFGNGEIDRSRLIEIAVDMLCHYFYD